MILLRQSLPKNPSSQAQNKDQEQEPLIEQEQSIEEEEQEKIVFEEEDSKEIDPEEEIFDQVKTTRSGRVSRPYRDWYTLAEYFCSCRFLPLSFHLSFLLER
jgi:hypothetical protein